MEETIRWKKIGKGSWINIPSGPSTAPIQESSSSKLRARKLRGMSINQLVATGFFDTKSAQNRTRSTLQGMNFQTLVSVI